MAVIYSSFIALFLATLCSTGTIPNRPALPTQSNQIQTDSKSPGRRIMHPAFANAGRSPGLEIWRIENFEPVAYPKNNYGKFYTGDSFIVLNTVQTKDKKFSWDVHFWLGSETSVDEAGAAAILTVQLDDLLNGGPVQHREVQDHESQLFLSYFKNGVRYEQGGIATSFKHVEINAQGEKRLFQVKGKRNVRVRQVNLSISSMNKGDCFILDAGNEIYVYVGAQAKRVEKLKAISAANQIRDQDHNGRARVHIIDEFSTDADKENFFNILGSGSPGQVPDESTAEEDGVFETTDANSVTLYKVSDASGSLKIDPISQKPLRQEMLNTQDCFILDTGSGIYVWVGRGATQKEKTDSLTKAQEFLRSKKYPAWTQIHRIVEGAESAPFKQYFATWRDAGMSHTRLVRSALGYDSDYSESDLDDVDSVLKNLKEKGGHAIGFMPDNGQNELSEITVYSSVYGTNDVEKQMVSYEEPMPLKGQNAYVITYTYQDKNDETGKLIYVWEGVKAGNANDYAFEDALSLASEENAILVRTVQNHEPRHFLKMFKGKLLTIANSTSVVPQLFHIRGTDDNDVHAFETKVDSSSLSSSDVYALVVRNESQVFIWIGLGASEIEKNAAENILKSVWPSFTFNTVEEGAEPDEFWELMNGEGIYDRSLNEKSAPILEPRLFHCRLINNKIKVEEIMHFEQADLDFDDVMLLDSGDEIYLWVGSGASADENGKILDIANKYITFEPTDRTIDTVSVIRIAQDHEPYVFKRMFPSWEKGYWEKLTTYEDVRKKVLEDNEHIHDNDV
uniref:Gelsolin-like domain-containing protein n=1 Tax=Glossina brevipalpis TaxID=37001 RepID=A0A1A9WIF6_9MUSC